MKLIGLLVLVGVGICFVNALRVTTWGKITNHRTNYTLLVPSSPNTIKIHVFRYPGVSE